MGRAKALEGSHGVSPPRVDIYTADLRHLRRKYPGFLRMISALQVSCPSFSVRASRAFARPGAARAEATCLQTDPFPWKRQPPRPKAPLRMNGSDRDDYSIRERRPDPAHLRQLHHPRGSDRGVVKSCSAIEATFSQTTWPSRSPLAEQSRPLRRARSGAVRPYRYVSAFAWMSIA